MSLPRFLLFGSKEQKNLDAVEPRAVQVSPSGGMKVWLDGMRNTFTMATSAVISSLPNITVSTMPSLTANPTKHTLLTQVLLGATDTTIYTAAAAYRDVIVYVNNVDSSARTAQLSLGTLDDTHSLVKAFPLAVGDRRVIEVPALANGNVLHGLCDSANKVTAEVWGIAV